MINKKNIPYASTNDNPVTKIKKFFQIIFLFEK